MGSYYNKIAEVLGVGTEQVFLLFEDLETANKFLSGYVFLLNSRFEKSFGVVGGRVV